MKKKGSTLTTVLIIMLVLITLGMTISSVVVKNLRYNKSYSEYVDLDLAARSAINLALKDLNFKIKGNDNSLPESYYINNETLQNVIKDSLLTYNVYIKKYDEKYVIKATVTQNDNSKTKSLTEEVKIKGDNSNIVDEENSDISQLKDRLYSAILKDENTILNVPNCQFNNVFFINNKNRPMANGAYYNGTNVEYDYYLSKKGEVLSSVSNNEKWPTGSIGIFVPKLELGNDISTGSYILEDGINSITLYTNGTYKVSYYENKKIFRCNGDLIIKNTNSWGFHYSKDVIIVVNGKVLFKPYIDENNRGENQMYPKKIALMANEIICESNLKTIYFKECLLISRKIISNTDEIIFFTPLPKKEYQKSIEIIDKIIKNKELF